MENLRWYVRRLLRTVEVIVGDGCCGDDAVEKLRKSLVGLLRCQMGREVSAVTLQQMVRRQMRIPQEIKILDQFQIDHVSVDASPAAVDERTSSNELTENLLTTVL